MTCPTRSRSTSPARASTSASPGPRESSPVDLTPAPDLGSSLGYDFTTTGDIVSGSLVTAGQERPPIVLDLLDAERTRRTTDPASSASPTCSPSTFALRLHSRRRSSSASPPRPYRRQEATVGERNLIVPIEVHSLLVTRAVNMFDGFRRWSPQYGMMLDPDAEQRPEPTCTTPRAAPEGSSTCDQRLLEALTGGRRRRGNQRQPLPLVPNRARSSSRYRRHQRHQKVTSSWLQRLPHEGSRPSKPQ